MLIADAEALCVNSLESCRDMILEVVVLLLQMYVMVFVSEILRCDDVILVFR